MESHLAKKKVICSGYYGFDNFGDEAVLKVLVEGLKDKYDITVLSSNPNKTQKSFNINAEYSFDYINAIKLIKDSDLFISGGGSLLQDVTSFKSLLYYLLLIYFAQLFNKTIIIYAQGIGPLNSVFSNFLVRTALKKCQVITVRDIESQNLLKNWGINSILVNDPVFSIPIQKIEHTGKIGIQLRSFKGIDERFLTELAKLINTTYTDKDIVLISLQDQLDLDITKKLAEKLKTKSCEIKSNLCINEAINEIAKLDKLIAMRFHAALIGLRAGVKVLPIAYDKKVKLLSENFKIDFVEIQDIFNETKISNLLKKLDNQNIKEIDNKDFNFSIFDI